jgi:transposase-like protein
MDVAVQAVLEAEMTEAPSAEKSAGVEGRQGYRSNYYSRSLTTRVGTLELRVPRDRAGCFPPRCSSVTSVRRRRW